MNNKKAKKLRKQYRKSINKMASTEVKTAMWKMARQRDVMTVIAILEFVIIIGGAIWLLLY